MATEVAIISPNAIIHVLMYDYFSKNRQAFFNSLSVAGSDGTLSNRFTNNDLRLRVFGKSGFVVLPYGHRDTTPPGSWASALGPAAASATSAFLLRRWLRRLRSRRSADRRMRSAAQ